MLKILLELAGAGVMALGRKQARKAAFKGLQESGLISKATRFGTKRADVAIRRLERGGFDAIRTAHKRRLARLPRAQRGKLGPMPTRGQYETAMRHLQRGKTFGAAGNIMWMAPTAAMGFSMFSDADRFFTKNIPGPAQEILQTQQMFLPRQAYTQRQRAIQAIHQSQMTTRSALGNEAQYMHG